MPAAQVGGPTLVAGRTVLEPGSPVVWFTFPGVWHDIGRFHRADGAFTGYYANILTPVEPGDVAGRRRGDPTVRGPTALIGAGEWRTTDLFLDVFIDLDDGIHVLDRDEFNAAVAHGWIDRSTARTAEREAARLTDAARAGEWPPPLVDAWPLGRARTVADAGDDGS